MIKQYQQEEEDEWMMKQGERKRTWSEVLAEDRMDEKGKICIEWKDEERIK